MFDAVKEKNPGDNVKLFQFQQHILLNQPAPDEDTEDEESSSEEEMQDGLESQLEEAYNERIELAEKILNTAREEAEKIRSDAREEGLKEGYESGYKEGIQQALSDVRAANEEEMEEVRKHIERFIRGMERKREDLLERYLEDLKDITLAIAEKVVHTSLKSSGEIIKRMIVSETEKLKKVSWAKIYIGRPENGSSVQGDAEFIHELSNLSDNVKIVVMEDAETGTCIIELPSETIDLSVATQLENIKGILENARH